MSRLLIVDDMPVIVDGLADLFREKTELGLEIFKAYSAFEATEILNRIRIDIVLTDIKMPVKTGIDLLKEIRARWPRCKVIFLTSYNEFDYAREAVANKGFDYILKTEGDERIVKSVAAALEAIRSEQEEEELINKAREQYKQAKPVLQKEYMTKLLEGRRPTPEMRCERFRNLEIPLDPNAPVNIILIRFDGGKEDMSDTEWIRRIYSVQNIMVDYLNGQVNLLPISKGQSDHIWFLQPAASASADKDEWDRIFHFVYGNLETVQSICEKTLRLKVSFIMNTKPIEWDELPEQYLRLETFFRTGIGLNSEVLLTDTELQKNADRQNITWLEDRVTGKGFRISRFTNLSEYLHNGQQEEFFRLYGELLHTMSEYGENEALILEVYHYLASIFLTYLNRWGVSPELTERIDTSRLKSFNEQLGWGEYARYFRQVAEVLFSCRTVDREKQTGKVVAKLREYIGSNLHSDLSLIQLSELVHLNSSYLSRLYKQITGFGLMEYIAEQRINRAKELLCCDDMKIHEIASALGYGSSIAFTRFFKKAMGITPQEYREMDHQDR